MFSTFTSESVCNGHPDKICDAISDTIVDRALEQDKNSRVAVETLVTVNKCVLAGEVRCSAKLNYDDIAKQVISKLGYTHPEYRFSDTSEIEVLIHEQSAEIAHGVDQKGAGDQGMMFGFACRETPELMPLPIMVAHGLTRAIDTLRETKKLPYLRPDGKAQVTIRYENGVPVAADSVVIAVPHSPEISLETVTEDVVKHALIPVFEAYNLSHLDVPVIVNGTGVWHSGGPAADTGVTGRKIIVDSYGGYARVGGGAFSGKDPTKVDRSGAYAARFIAKNIVSQGLADKCEVRLAYVIGRVEPVMQDIETFGTEKAAITVIQDFAKSLIDTSVWGIIERFNLQRPIYAATASYGHFGRGEFPWEEVV